MVAVGGIEGKTNVSSERRKSYEQPEGSFSVMRDRNHIFLGLGPCPPTGRRAVSCFLDTSMFLLALMIDFGGTQGGR